MRRLFKVGSDRHDEGRVTFSWHPDGNFLASAGKNGEFETLSFCSTQRPTDNLFSVPAFIV